MKKNSIQHVTIIGVGLLGGSAGLALKAFDPSIRITGVGRRRSSLDDAMEVGAIDDASLDTEAAVKNADVVLLCTPVGAFSQHLKSMKPVLKKKTLITDMGSTKRSVVRSAERILGKEASFVGSHPMAGSEQKGVTAARADLFCGATCIITPTKYTHESIAARAEKLWKALDMHVVRMSPDAHDRATARVSHLPHALASLIMLLPGEDELEVSASGFRDTTRLASGDPEMWRDIFLTNRSAVLGAIDQFEKSLHQLRNLVDAKDADGIEKLLADAKNRRDQTIAQRLQDRRMTLE